MGTQTGGGVIASLASVPAGGTALAPTRRADIALMVTGRGSLAVDAHDEFGG